MTPKEKAVQLFSKMCNVEDSQYSKYRVNDYVAVECALIAVNEFLSFQENLFITEGSIAYTYWQEVKKELENFSHHAPPNNPLAF